MKPEGNNAENKTNCSYLQALMDWALVAILSVIFQPCLSTVLFTVEAEQTTYKAEFGGQVEMGCKFSPKPSHPNSDLKVTWHWITATPYQEVIRIENRMANCTSQKYQGRVKLLMNELNDGWAKLQLSNLRINDTGAYQCLVETAEGIDYKTITLMVGAPYKSGTKHIERTEEKDKVLLTCQSEGYPESLVVWEDGHQQKHSSNTTSASTPDQLLKVTSRIKVSSTEKKNYTCHFTNGGYSATFHIPDEIPAAHGRNDVVIFLLSTAVIILVATAGVLTYRRHKGTSTPRTANHPGVDFDMPITGSACQSEQGDKEEELGLHLKAYYSEHILSNDMRHHCKTFSVEELPHRLQNKEGHPVTIQDLLPETGEVLLLEGPPGSGKTSIAHILLSSWTEEPILSLCNAPDLSPVGVFIHVNCSEVKGKLFQEITARLSLSEKLSAEELQTVLSGSRKSLLLLDGYREENDSFDESLRRFISERGNCRVLVTACPGQCPTFKQMLGTHRVLSLQTHYAKY